MDGTQVGKINKIYSGFVREAFSNADKFGIHFPLDLSGILISYFTFYNKKLIFVYLNFFSQMQSYRKKDYLHSFPWFYFNFNFDNFYF